jgi:hypothetical protein
MLRIACVLSALLLLSLGQPARAQYDPGWCLGPEGDQFSVTVEDSAFTVFHQGARYNCCPDSIEFQVSIDGDLISLREVEHLESGGCACSCCFNLSATVGGLAPGVYRLWVYWYEYGWTHWEGEVTIPDAGQSGEMSLMDRYLSACLEQGPTPADSPTWGRIKKLFVIRD